MKHVLTLPLLLLAAACTSGRGAPEAAPAAATPSVSDATLAEPAPSAAVAAPADASAVQSLSFVAQPEWIEEPPASAMRAAQFRLPGEAGEATLVVFHFKQAGGTLEANLERWAGQFEQPDGGDSAARMTRASRSVGGFDMWVVDLAGTYVAETFPGSGERVREADWRLLAAVIETSQGPYYAKLVGPRATVAAHAARFDAFLAALPGS